MCIFIVNMQAMEKAVGGRRQYDADIGDERNPTEQGIDGREYLAAGVLYLHHQAHAAQYHGSIVQGVYPGHARSVVITNDTKKQAGREQQ